tara:strand:+ start:1671 stop:2093 length:423 start_codon:yes stop_codon:yes gene_type:complete
MSYLYSYVLPRPFYGYNIPIALQSTCIRDYSKKNNFVFCLPVTEITKSNCFTMLSYLFESKKQKITNLGVVSGFVLPILDTKLLKKIFNSKNINKNLKIHMILENKIFSINELYRWSNNIQTSNLIVDDYSFVKKIKNLY